MIVRCWFDRVTLEESRLPPARVYWKRVTESSFGSGLSTSLAGVAA
jgi:hypothetical protein